MKLVLASNSPRRKELLTQAGFSFDVIAADIDETPFPEESPERFAVRMAREKTAAVAHQQAQTGTVILAADTIVTLDGRILGKPKDDADAIAMLKSLSGRTHAVITGWALATARQEILEQSSSYETTNVTFRPLSDAEIAAYVASGEPQDKAGAYAIQGGAGAFVSAISGDRDNVIGLPVAKLTPLIKAALAKRD